MNLVKENQNESGIMRKLETTMAIRELHSFAIPTRFLEVGCGHALADLLFSQNSASNTIYDSYSPYNRDAQIAISPEIANHRAVSLETTKLLMESLFMEKQLCYYVAEFQIGGNPKQQKTTHGYIGVAGPDQIPTYYHITIPGEDDREVLLDEIAKVGLSIKHKKMHNIVDSHNENLIINHVDQVFNNNLIQDTKTTLDLFLKSEIDLPYDTDNLLCYRGGKFHRFEDFFRDKKNILIYRGTFNPITNAHMEIFNEACDQLDADFTCLMVAHSIYGKAGLSVEEIQQRMMYADALGVPLLIGNSFRYLDTIKHFRKRTFEKNTTTLNFLMGADTIERVIEFEDPLFYMDPFLNDVTYVFCERKGFEFKQDFLDKIDQINIPKLNPNQIKMVKLKNFVDHDGISATQVRALLKESNLTEIAKLIPEQILQAIIKNQIK